MRTVWVYLFMASVLVWGCSSSPEPQPEASKKEIRQDSEGFFKKMKQEEDAGKSATP